MINSEELIGTTGHSTLYGRCRLNSDVVITRLNCTYSIHCTKLLIFSDNIPFAVKITLEHLDR
jgi:hypothetical protein